MRLARVLSAALAATAALASNSSGPENVLNRSWSCPTYPTAVEAAEACSGADDTFMTWGEYETNASRTNGTTESTFGEVSARVGPYHCSKCGFGFVGVMNESIPPRLANTSSSTHRYLGPGGDEYVGTCLEVEGSGENISCAALQRTCEDNDFGWLIYAETFDSRDGVYMCAGCNDAAINVIGTGDDDDDGDTSLSSWPMLMMYGMIIVVLAVALYIDAKVFVHRDLNAAEDVGLTTSSPDVDDLRSGSARQSPEAGDEINPVALRERQSWYLLYLVGYVDIDGQIIPWYKAVCYNRLQGLCCCRNKVDCGNFISMLLVTLGVAVLFKDGQLVEYNCYFDATNTLHDTYQRQFLENFYGQTDRPKGGIPWTVPIDYGTSGAGFWIAEAIVIGYQFSIDLLTHGLSEGGYMTRFRAILLMTFLSAIFCASAMASEWDDMSMQMLYVAWFTGFLVALFIYGPISSAISHLVGRTLVSTGILPLPKAESEESTAPVQATIVEPPAKVAAMATETTTQHIEADGTVVIEKITTNPDGSITVRSEIITPAAAAYLDKP